jgi:two-component system, chemotaxis family, protein-glutamate methylesterase/glutaminase
MSIPRDIIVIGAAEGGRVPLTKLTNTLPASLPAAVLVALHTHPQSLSVLGELMDSHGAMPVSYGREGQEIARGHIYLTPPDSQLIVRATGVLGLEAHATSHEARPAVDRLFCSAAEVFGHRVIGVILSGCDGDGTDGMKMIEKADGIGIVQDPDDAAVSEMPSHALEHNRPHYVAPIEGITTLLVTLTAQQRSAT